MYRAISRKTAPKGNKLHLQIVKIHQEMPRETKKSAPSEGSMKRKRVTIPDLASELNLSNRAVSQALNPRECSVKVSPETVKRVQELALKRGYRPDSRARSMRYGKFFNIGYFEAKINPVALPLPGAQNGVYEVASDAGYRVTLIQLPSNTSEPAAAIPHVFSEDMLDVLILSHAGNLPSELVEQIDSSGYPVVYLNEKRPTNAIYSNDIEGAEAITQHLIDLGHQRIACIAYPSSEREPHYSIADRIEGYTQAMTRAGLTPIFADTGHARNDSQDCLLKWFRKNHEKIDALMCGSDFDAMVSMRTLYEYRHLFPDKIAITGYDDMGTALSALPLTTMKLSFYQMGRDAAKMAIELVDRPSKTKPSISVTPELIVRSSTSAGV